MKKTFIIAAVGTVVLATALVAVPAAAASSRANAAHRLYNDYGSALCGGGLALNNETTLQRVAPVLGITYDQLVLRLNNGETIAAIATAQKIDLSKVVDAIVLVQTEMVTTMVKYGYASQEQADAIVANLKNRVEATLSGTVETAADYACAGLGDIGGITAGDSDFDYGCGLSAPDTDNGYGCGMMGDAGLGGVTGTIGFRGMMGR